MNQVIQGDCLEVMQGMADCSVDAVVTDPPAGIAFMNKTWDKDKGGKAQWIEWMTDVARECLRVIKPGGHALVWAIPRTSHWTGTAWENAGWEPRDKIYHCFGSGFPKSHNLDGDWQGWGSALKPAIEEWWLLRRPLQGTIAQNVQEWGTGGLNIAGCRVSSEPVRKNTAGGLGYASGTSITAGTGTTMHTAGRWPANVILSGEPEVVGCFPETVSGEKMPEHKRNVPRLGNVYHGDPGGQAPRVWKGDSGSAARFFKQCPDTDPEDAETRRLFYCGKATKRDRDEGLEGLWDVIIHIAPLNNSESWENAAPLARLQVDTELSRPRVIGASGILSRNATEWNTLLSGSESTAVCRMATMFTTRTKTSLTTELKILSWFLRSLISESIADARLETEFGGSHVESVGIGTLQATITSGLVASALGVENAASQTQLKISVSERRNDHVTVKPTDLMRYLCRLITPPGGIILDPLTGSGSTGKAAVLEGFGFIGIEQDPEYVAIANARIAAAAARSEKATLEQRVAWLETQTQALGAKVKRLEASQQLSLWNTV